MKTIILPVLFFASLASAQENQIQYTEKVVPFTEWSAKYPKELSALGLYKNELTVNYVDNGVAKTGIASLMMYVTRVRISIAKEAAKINLPNLVKVESLAQLDPELKSQVITAEQIMPKMAGRGPVPNFKWCNKSTTAETTPIEINYILLPNYEQDLSYLNRERPWCLNDGKTVCVEACFPFDEKWSAGVQAYNLYKTAKKLGAPKPEDLKDEGVGMQIEARYYTDEAEFGQSVKELTQVNSPVRGIVELNIFYVNQVLQYGKVVAVFQDHPQSPQATVVTTLSAIGIRKKSWDKKDIREALKGESSINTKTGLTAGIPIFTKNIAKALASLLEKAP